MQHEQKKTNNRSYIIAAICIIGICATPALRGCGSSATDNNISAGVDAVRGGIADSVNSNTELQEQLSGIRDTANSVEGSIERSEAAITNAEATAGSVADNLNAAEAAITNCQRIIDGIKRRNEEGTAKP